jgi:hypothetical protein
VKTGNARDCAIQTGNARDCAIQTGNARDYAIYTLGMLETAKQIEYRLSYAIVISLQTLPHKVKHR